MSPSRPRGARWAAGAAAFAVALAACSGGDDATTTTVASSTSTTEVDAAADTAADTARAEEILFKPSDLPEGWTPVPAPEGAEEEQAELRSSFAVCLGVEPLPDHPSAESPEYVTGEITQVSARVELAPSAEVAEAELAQLRRPRYLECVAKQFDQSQADSGLEFAPSRAQEFDFPDLADGTLATRITTLLTLEGQEITIYADLVVVREGRVQITMYFLRARQPFPADLADSLARRMLARA